MKGFVVLYCNNNLTAADGGFLHWLVYGITLGNTLHNIIYMWFT